MKVFWGFFFYFFFASRKGPGWRDGMRGVWFVVIIINHYDYRGFFRYLISGTIHL